MGLLFIYGKQMAKRAYFKAVNTIYEDNMKPQSGFVRQV